MDDVGIPVQGVVSALVFALLLIAFCYCCGKRYRNGREREPHNPNPRRRGRQGRNGRRKRRRHQHSPDLQPIVHHEEGPATSNPPWQQVVIDAPLQHHVVDMQTPHQWHQQHPPVHHLHPGALPPSQPLVIGPHSEPGQPLNPQPLLVNQEYCQYPPPYDSLVQQPMQGGLCQVSTSPPPPYDVQQYPPPPHVNGNWQRN